MISGLNETKLAQWIDKSLAENSNTLSHGYQGKVLVYANDLDRYVIKVPHGTGLTKYIHTFMLKHEFNVYRKLAGFPGCPECFGMIQNKYLVLEYIDGQAIREKRPANDKTYFNELLNLIKTMHSMQVAHMDLKRKDNLLVTSNDHPCLIDFGTAVIRKSGFHPVNAFLFSLAKRFDYNAWIKHKYHNNMDAVSDTDLLYYKQTLIEKYAGLIKRNYTKLKSFLKL